MMKTKRTMLDLPEENRPYEKCLRYGPEALTDAELLGVILRTGTRGMNAVEAAGEVLSLGGAYQGLTGLFHCSAEDLRAIPGIGAVKAVQIRCIAEMAQRIARTAAEKRLKFKEPDTIADYYMERLRHEEQEIVLCMMLDTKNKLLGDAEITRGTVNLSLISPREIFLRALSFRAVKIILVHNHQSGDPTPSDQDIWITGRIREAGELLGICLLDHIIIGDMSYVSMSEQNLLAGMFSLPGEFTAGDAVVPEQERG